MTTINHYRRALDILDAAADLASSIEAGLSEPFAPHLGATDKLNAITARQESARLRLQNLGQMHAAAGVHATLALVEQQRAANLIAAGRTQYEPLDRNQAYATLDGIRDEYRDDIERIIL